MENDFIMKKNEHPEALNQTTGTNDQRTQTTTAYLLIGMKSIYITIVPLSAISLAIRSIRFDASKTQKKKNPYTENELIEKTRLKTSSSK